MQRPQLETAATRMAVLVASVGEGDRDQPTPCPGYTVGALVDHIAGMVEAFTAAGTKSQSKRSLSRAPSPKGPAARPDP